MRLVVSGVMFVHETPKKTSKMNKGRPVWEHPQNEAVCAPKTSPISAGLFRTAEGILSLNSQRGQPWLGCALGNSLCSSQQRGSLLGLCVSKENSIFASPFRKILKMLSREISSAFSEENQTPDQALSGLSVMAGGPCDVQRALRAESRCLSLIKSKFNKCINIYSDARGFFPTPLFTHTRIPT